MIRETIFGILDNVWDTIVRTFKFRKKGEGDDHPKKGEGGDHPKKGGEHPKGGGDEHPK